MKRRLLVPAILATATALAAPVNGHTETLDAQAQAAALLSGANAAKPIQTNESSYALSSSENGDAHASAAALLSGRAATTQARTSTRVAASADARTHLDAHAHAATLLRGSRITVEERSQSTRRSEASNDHPAVLVAKTWSARGIDPNTFIVGHPARLQLASASPTSDDSAANQSAANARVATLAR
jgi:hypothetical protein